MEGPPPAHIQLCSGISWKWGDVSPQARSSGRGPAGRARPAPCLPDSASVPGPCKGSADTAHHRHPRFLAVRRELDQIIQHLKGISVAERGASLRHCGEHVSSFFLEVSFCCEVCSARCDDLCGPRQDASSESFCGWCLSFPGLTRVSTEAPEV